MSPEKGNLAWKTSGCGSRSWITGAHIEGQASP